MNPKADPAAAPPSFQQFVRNYPDYAGTSALDTLRVQDFARLDEHGEVYLDYTGGGLYGASQLQAHLKMLEVTTFGNPHSNNPTSSRSTVLMEQARAAVLDYFRAPADDYEVVFTPNASGALRLVGESYPFARDGCFLQLADNHNSVNGIREFAKRAGAVTDVVLGRASDLRVEPADVPAALKRHQTGARLFAYPAQSNFSGVQHPLEWIGEAQAMGWDVLVDAAAFVPTNAFDIGRWQPDFVPVSFYKMFGWPTGVGCLIAKKSALNKLGQVWFGGGTIWAVSVQGDWHIPAPGHEAFEDGTVNYLNLPAVTAGLDYLKQVGIPLVHTRVMCLTGWLLDRLVKLKHHNGNPVAQLYGPAATDGRGGTIAFNFLDPDGRVVDERIVERLAGRRNISLRTGCFCNPGAGEVAFGLRPAKLKAGRREVAAMRHDDYLARLGMQSAGAIRVSLGLASNFADAEAFVRFAEQFTGPAFDASGLPERGHC